MPAKLLTSIRNVEQHAAMVIAATRQATAMLLLKREAEARMAGEVARRMGTSYLDTVTLLRLARLAETGAWLTAVEPLEARVKAQTALRLPEAEALELTRLAVPAPEAERRLAPMRLRLRRVEVEADMPPLERLRPALVMVEHQALAMLEAYLQRNMPDLYTRALETLIQAAKQHTRFLRRLPGLEWLQKLLAEVYYLPWMPFPYTLNMFAVRVTPKIMELLRGKPAALYVVGALPAEAMKTKPLTVPAQRRRLETKAVVSGKRRREGVPVKHMATATFEVTPEVQVPITRGIDWRELAFMALRYAYSMPYWVRRWIARHLGMPEDHRYAGYFGIAAVPAIRGLWAWMTRWNPNWLRADTRARDVWLKLLGWYFKARYGVHRPRIHVRYWSRRVGWRRRRLPRWWRRVGEWPYWMQNPYW